MISYKFDLLPSEERRREFASIIAALKRGEIPHINVIGD
jgi:hypothetical protein